MKRWEARRLHITSGQSSLATFDARTRLAALEQVNSWNENLPGIWQYWLLTEIETSEVER